MLWENLNKDLVNQKAASIGDGSKLPKGLPKNSAHSERNKEIEFKQKKQFKENLMNIAEHMCKQNREKLRMKKISEVKYKCRPELDYESKNVYIENCIENKMLYFRAYGLDESKNNYLMNLRQELIRNELKMRIRRELETSSLAKKEKLMKSLQISKNDDGSIQISKASLQLGKKALRRNKDESVKTPDNKVR